MKSSVILTKILQEELKPVINSASVSRLTFEEKLAAAQKNLNEARTELILRRSKLVEYKVASKATDPNFRIKKPWKDVKAESILKLLGAKPFRLGINPHGYELDLPNDRLWFYSDGEVLSTNSARNLGYTVSGDEIILWNAKGGDTSKTGFKVGTIKLSGGAPVFTPSKENLEKSDKDAESEEPEESNSTLDTIQLILDYAGFIPVIGDALDGLNAIISFIRGNWFEGLLSLIAVIPLVGTSIKFGIKAIYKAAKLDKLFGLIKQSFKTGNPDVLWKELMSSGAIKPEQLKDLGTGLGTVADTLKSSYSGIKQIPFLDSKSIIKELDAFTTWMKNSSKSIDDLASASAKTGAKQLYKSAESISKNVGILRKFGNSLTLNVLPKLKRAPFWPEAKIQKIALGLEKRFSREFAADSTKLTELVRLAPNQNVLLSKLRKDMIDRVSSLPKASQNEFRKRLQQAGLLKNNKNLTLNSADDWHKFLETTNIYPATRGLYDSAAQQIVKHSMENNSILWNVYKTDRLNNLKTIMSKDMIPEGSSLFKELDFSFRKNVDIIWDEMQDVAESFGIKDQDDVNGVIWPMITMATAEYLPGVYDAGKTIQGWITALKDSPEGQATIETVRDMAGLDGQSAEKYDPESTKGGEYK